MTHFLMSRRPFAGLFLVCLLSLLAGCGGESAAPTSDDEGVEQTVAVDTTADLLVFYPKFKRHHDVAILTSHLFAWMKTEQHPHSAQHQCKNNGK